GVDEELLGHAAADDAGAAEAVFLRDRHLGAMPRGDAGGAHASRAAADDEEVVVELAHWPVRASIRRFELQGGRRVPGWQSSTPCRVVARRTCRGLARRGDMQPECIGSATMRTRDLLQCGTIRYI